MFTLDQRHGLKGYGCRTARARHCGVSRRGHLQAGAGLCHEDAVRFTVEQSAAVVDWLVAQGVDFDLRNDQPDDEFREFHLTMEGGHSIRRILHAADQTGSAISNALNHRIAECETWRS